MKNTIVLIICSILTGNAYSAGMKPENRKAVSQYGITWEFDKPAMTGQFITGDWWVIGPITVVKITPNPGEVKGQTLDLKKNKWGDTSLKNDMRMLNGAMIVDQCGPRQGYDSRTSSYDPALSVKLPCKLGANKSLISSISNTTLPVDHFCKDIMWGAEKQENVVLSTAAVLTSLAAVPPEDAFRPSYVGDEKTIYQAKDVQWGLLGKLKPAGKVPAWKDFERYFERPWLDHMKSWAQQQLNPNQNQPPYGREHARLTSMASLMLNLDVPLEQKRKLAIGLIQYGIDLSGCAKNGGSWNEGGGHSSGRKWPVLFASMMLNNPKLNELPDSTFFQEDAQTYYGKGWFGQTAMWQMIIHHGQRDTYEEKPPEKWAEWDKHSESYRICCNASSWAGTALAARQMKAIKLWEHDAFFDYIERWMREDDPYKAARGSHPRPVAEGKALDQFVTDMWKAHRKDAPEQPMSGKSNKFVWQGSKEAWVANPH